MITVLAFTITAAGLYALGWLDHDLEEADRA